MTSEVPLVLASSGTEALMELQGGVVVEIGSSLWFNWLSRNTSFRFESGFAGEDSFTARKHQRDSGDFWYAYRKVAGKLRNAYLGKTESLTVGKMLVVAAKLSQPQATVDVEKQGKSYAKECITEDSQVVELQGKISQLENQLTALQRELDQWKAKALEAEIIIPNLEDELDLLKEELIQTKTQQVNLDEVRDRVLAKTRLGRQAPEYKRSKKIVDMVLAELDSARSRKVLDFPRLERKQEGNKPAQGE